MSATIRIPPTLRAEVGGERQIAAEGGTVREVLDDLMERFPALRAQLVEDDDIAPFVNVYVEARTSARWTGWTRRSTRARP